MLPLIKSSSQKTAYRVLALLRNFKASIQRQIIGHAPLAESNDRNRILDANLAITREITVDGVLQTMMDHLRVLIPFDTASIMLKDASMQLELCLTQGYDVFLPELDLEKVSQSINEWALLHQVLQCRESLLVPNVADDPRWRTVDNVVGISCWMGVPLLAADGETIGIISLDKYQPYTFTEDHVLLVESLSASAGITIERARLIDRIRNESRTLEEVVDTRTKDLQREIVARQNIEKLLLDRTAQLTSLRMLSLKLTSILDIDHILSQIVHQAVGFLDGDGGMLFLMSETGGDDRLRVQYGMPYNDMIGASAELNVGVAGTVWAKQRPIVVNDYPNWENARRDIKSSDKSVMGAPLLANEQFLGTIVVVSSVYDRFGSDDIDALQLYALQASIAIQNAKLHRQVQDHAMMLESHVAARTKELQDTNGKLRIANRKLKEIDVLRSKLISDISHELRTPLANIGLYVELIQRRPQMQARYVKTIVSQLQRLETLLEDIAHVGYLEKQSAAENLEFDPVQLNDVITQVVRRFAEQIPGTDVEMRSSLDATLPLIWANQQQIDDLVTHLLSNAVKYTEQGGIYISTRWDDRGQVCLEIADTGTGIDEQDLNHLYEPFYRGKGARQSSIPGTGIGLTIVKKIIDLHEGRIAIENALEGGTICRVYLPSATAPQ